MPTSSHTSPRDEIIRVSEKVAALEQWREETEDYKSIKEKVASLEIWRTATELELKEIHEAVTQFKLLMSLSIGGGGLSVLTLIVTIVLLVTGNK